MGGSIQSWAPRSRGSQMGMENRKRAVTAVSWNRPRERRHLCLAGAGPSATASAPPASPQQGLVLLSDPTTSAAEQGPRRTGTLQPTLGHPALPEATPGPGARASAPPKTTRPAASSHTSPRALFISPQIPESRWRGRPWPNPPGPACPCAEYKLTKQRCGVGRDGRAVYFPNCGSGRWAPAALGSSFCR